MVLDGSIVRVDVYFSLVFRTREGEWRYTDAALALATRRQRSDGAWVTGDDHALPLVAFMRAASQGPPIGQAFAARCAERYTGTDKVELSRLVESDPQPTDATLPKALRDRFTRVEERRAPKGFDPRPAIVVGLIGPDGSGKTTLCDLVERTLDGWVVRAYLGQKDYVLPGVGFAERRGGSFFNKLFRYLGYPLDLLVRWRPISFRARGKILLIDRLPMFPFTGESGRLMSAVYKRALPRFDLLIRLGGDDRVIYNRKPEGDFATFSKNAQKAREMNIGGLADLCVELDATKPLEEVLDTLLGSLFATPTFRTRFLKGASQA